MSEEERRETAGKLRAKIKKKFGKRQVKGRKGERGKERREGEAGRKEEMTTEEGRVERMLDSNISPPLVLEWERPTPAATLACYCSIAVRV